MRSALDPDVGISDVRERPPGPLVSGTPRWFEAGLLLAVLAVVCCGGVGLALADAGHYTPAVAIGTGLLLAALLAVPGLRALTRGAVRRPDRDSLPAVVALGLAVVSAVWNAWWSGTWINVDRDPGAYALTARWISQHGTLQVPFGDSWAFTDAPVTGSSAAVYTAGDHLEFQFDHLLPVLLAEVRDLFGDRAMFSANAVLAAVGLLAVYAVGARLTGRPWITVAAVGALGLSLPVLYVSRTTFSEVVAMLLVWAAAWLLLAAWDRSPGILGGLAGFALGASVMARIDSLVYLLVLPVLAGVVAWVGAADGRRRRVSALAGAAVAGAVPGVVLGTVDVVVRSGDYYRELEPQIKPLQMATVLALVVGVALVALAWRAPGFAAGVARVVAARREWLGRIAGAAVGLGLLWAWLVRPAVDHPVGDPNPTVLGLQQAEGLTADPGRLYAEFSVVWMSWYLGPVTVALAVVGLAWMVLSAARGRAAAVVVLAVAGAASALYLYRLSNTPDQLFGMRRFVPTAMPLFALGAAAALAALPSPAPGWWRARLRDATGRWWRVLVAVATVVVLALPASQAWSLRDFSPRRGSLAMIDATCAALGPSAAVVFPTLSYGSLTYPQMLRDYCGVPVAVAQTSLSVAELHRAAQAWGEQGRTLWVVDSTTENLTELFGAGAAVRTLGRAVDSRDIVDTLSRPATTYAPWEATVYGLELPASG